jgi:hypothetical protein
MYAFVHIEKTAGRTIKAILQRSFGSGHCDIRTPYARRAGDVRDQRVHVTAADLRHNVKPYSDLADAAPDLRYFTYLRDPVRRYLSHYLNRAGSHTRADFEQWAAAGWTHDWQTKMLAGEASAQKAIDLLASRIGFVGLTETFDESLMMLAQWLGEPGFRPEYRPVNRLADKSRARDAAREHTDLGYLELPEVRERLREINALDQQVYDFAVREACARQRQAYRGNLESEVRRSARATSRLTDLDEPLSGRLVRNWVYKPLRVLRLA